MNATPKTPLDAILAAADDAKRAHDRLRDLAETLLPESSPVKTADNPAPVVLPTVDEVADAIALDDGYPHKTIDPAYLRNARAVLDLIAARMPVWVPVEPDDIKVGNRVRLVTAQGDESIYTVTWRDQDWINGHDETRDTRFPHTWFIDPRTVPAEPDAALIADLRQYVTSATSDDELRDMIAAVRKADAARADQ